MAGDSNHAKIQKFSLSAKKPVHEFRDRSDNYLMSLSSSYDSKLLFMGFTNGFLGVFNIQTNHLITNFPVLKASIYSMACIPDNSGAYINDYSGAVRLIKWKENPFTEDDFDLSEEARRGPAKMTKHISLTNDSKKLFVCSKDMIRLCWPLLLSSTKEYHTNSET